jgi:hypothetical protein
MLHQSDRSDTLNSTTLFVNPNDVQSFSSHQQQHQQEQPGGSGQQQGVKRRHSETEAPVEVIVMPGGHNITQEHFIFPDDMDEIPLGGSADMEQGNLQKQDTLSIPFDTVLFEGHQRLKVEQHGQDSNQSWASQAVVTPGSGDLTMVAAAQQSPSGENPSTVNWPGQFQFNVQFAQLSRQSKNKHWDYSTDLRKLYIDMNKWVQTEFRVGPAPPADLWVRALPVYAEASHIREPVHRCPNHASPQDPTNLAPEFSAHPTHLIRMDGDETLYCDDTNSGRLSVLFPVMAPHQGTEYTSKLVKFMCLGSDVGGINRRPLKVVFTLEMGVGHVVGRKVVEVRICSCPKRDRQQEEQRAQQQDEQVKRIAQRFANSAMVVQQPTPAPPPGKKKLDKEPVIMVPVHCDDFKKLNEFAEAAWICRDPGNNVAIKEKRRQLLENHNKDHIRNINKKKPTQ